MKRRFKPKTGFPLSKTAGDIARNRGFQKPLEMRKAKRVRFDDSETDVSSRGHEANQSPRCGAPKTSEYAYFRKVKDGAANNHCRALHKENEQHKSSKISYLRRESNESEKLDPGINFSISRESAGTSRHTVSISPPVTRYSESNEIRRKELSHKMKERLPLLTETVTPVGQNPFSSPLNPATEKSDNQCIGKGIFSEKRERLRQWVAHSTSSEVETLHEKGSDSVSVLLGRLIPKGNETNDSTKEISDTNSKALTIHAPDNIEKGHSLIHNRDLHNELPNSSSERSREIIVRQQDSYDSEFPTNHHKEGHVHKSVDHSERSSEIVLKNWDSFHFGFPSGYNNEGRLQNETMMDPYQHTYGHICHSPDTRRGFPFCLPFESFNSMGAFHPKYIDESVPIIGHGREESYGNSWEWDFETEKDRADQSMRQNVFPRPANAWNSKKHGIVDNVLDTEGFYPSPLSRHCLFKPLPRYVRTSCLMPEVQPNFDDVKYAMVEPRQLPLSFPGSPNCISLAQNGNAEEFLSNRSIILSYRDPRWQRCTPHSDFWWNFMSAPEFFAEDHPSSFDAWKFPENDNGSCSLPLLKEAPEKSFTSYDDVGTFDNYPLLLNSVRLNQELYSDDYDSELSI